jgi:hypothetical protein
MHCAEGAMSYITEDQLSFDEISDYWSLELHPTASRDVLRRHKGEYLCSLEQAWWNGEILGDVDRLDVVKRKFRAACEKPAGVGIPEFIFIVENSAYWRMQFSDGSLGVHTHQVHVPSDNPDTWTIDDCQRTFDDFAEITALCKKCGDDFEYYTARYIRLTRQEFIDWVEKSRHRHSRPTFWRPIPKLGRPKGAKDRAPRKPRPTSPNSDPKAVERQRRKRDRNRE